MSPAKLLTHLYFVLQANNPRYKLIEVSPDVRCEHCLLTPPRRTGFSSQPASPLTLPHSNGYFAACGSTTPLLTHPPILGPNGSYRCCEASQKTEQDTPTTTSSRPSADTAPKDSAHLLAPPKWPSSHKRLAPPTRPLQSSLAKALHKMAQIQIPRPLATACKHSMARTARKKQKNDHLLCELCDRGHHGIQCRLVGRKHVKPPAQVPAASNLQATRRRDPIARGGWSSGTITSTRCHAR